MIKSLKKVRLLNQKHIEHEDNINDNGDMKSDITTQLEGEALKHEHIHGGEAYNARTVQDLGFEDNKWSKWRSKSKEITKKKEIEGSGEGPIVLGEKVGCGVSGRSSITLKDIYDMVRQPEQTVDAYETVRAKGYDHPEEIKGQRSIRRCQTAQK
jgi:hypothetical protein